MILRLSDSLSRGLVASCVLLGLWLSFFGIRAAIARYGVEEDTANGLKLAVRLEPENPSYWYFLGRYQQYNLEQSNAVMALESYRKAIALNSRATDAWLDLEWPTNWMENLIRHATPILRRKKNSMPDRFPPADQPDGDSSIE